ncbi:MAG: hypothetical protein IKA47_02470, partial [Oscillospiraceae bacterium]|nr:hypothetical protein [Oscillospiraceae bacterium]
AMLSGIILSVHSVRSFWLVLCGSLILPLDRHYGYFVVSIAGSFYNAPKFLYDCIASVCSIGNTLVAGIVGLFLIFLFIQSYKKQTDYVRKQVEKYVSERE